MLHRVKDLSPEQKVAVEALLGRPVSSDEAGQRSSSRQLRFFRLNSRRKNRTEALHRKLDSYFAKVDSGRKTVSEEEEEAVFEEAQCGLCVPTTGPLSEDCSRCNSINPRA